MGAWGASGMEAMHRRVIVDDLEGLTHFDGNHRLSGIPRASSRSLPYPKFHHVGVCGGARTGVRPSCGIDGGVGARPATGASGRGGAGSLGLFAMIVWRIIVPRGVAGEPSIVRVSRVVGRSSLGSGLVTCGLNSLATGARDQTNDNES